MASERLPSNGIATSSITVEGLSLFGSTVPFELDADIELEVDSGAELVRLGPAIKEAGRWRRDVIAGRRPGEVMLSPKLEARMLQELTLSPEDKVLEIGTGSGYVSALLSRLVSQVVSIEIVPQFTERAQGKLQAAGASNVALEVGDGANGWEQAAPYDAILLTGSVPVLPESFKLQLKHGGRLLAVIGEEPVMTARRITRVTDTDYGTSGLFETCIPALRNVRRPTRFVF